MAVVVVDKGPDPSVVKRVICQNCGAKLEYTPRDIKRSTSSDGDGVIDVTSYIRCPECKEKISCKE